MAVLQRTAAERDTNQGHPESPSEIAGVTILIPCLNEAASLPALLAELQAVVAHGGFGDSPVEILVSDNGSTDGSADLARSAGAAVTHCPRRGYGAALRHGIEQARFDRVIFLDADLTYDPADAPSLFAASNSHADLVIGSRMDGTIHPRAMPLLHRYIGTPVLTALINLFFNRHGGRLNDANSGFRCVRRDRFLAWNITSPGMEFASEMLIKALKSGARISQVPVSLRPNLPDRQPHLQTWHDGMRHLLQILLEAPFVFWYVSLVMCAIGMGTEIATLFGPFHLMGVSIFGIHTAIVAMLCCLLGQNLWSIGLFISAKSDRPIAGYRYAANIREGQLFWIITVSLGILAASLTWALSVWWEHGLTKLDLAPEFVIGATATIGLVQGLSALVAASLIKRIV